MPEEEIDYWEGVPDDFSEKKWMAHDYPERKPEMYYTGFCMRGCVACDIAWKAMEMNELGGDA